jgi:Tfp pilus assembly protein PilN
MKAVNLLPPDRRDLGRTPFLGPLASEPLLTAAITLVVVVVGGLVLASHSASSKVATRNHTLRQLDARLATLEAEKRSASAAGTASRLSSVTTIAGQRTSWDDFLGTISRVVPEDVWLLSLSAAEQDATTSTTSTPPPAPNSSGAPTAVTVTGYTYSQPSVARMMRRLELVPWLQDVSLVTSAKSAIADHTVYQFTLGANFVTRPGANVVPRPEAET